MTLRNAKGMTHLPKVKVLRMQRAAWENDDVHLELWPHRWPETAAEAARSLEH